jgi:signal transduction histidine kinase
MKISSKLFVLLVSLILTSLLAASFVSINVLSMAMSREIIAHLEDDSANFMNRISMDTSNRISDITFLGDSMNIFLNQFGTDLGRKVELLKKFIDIHSDYSSISIYNKTGIKIADSKGIGIDENVSNESFFKEAIQGHIYRDGSTSNYLKSSKEKEILLSGPLYDKADKISEILVLSYPLNNNIIGQRSTGLQSNLRINLLSDDGKVIYSNYDNRSLSNAGAASSFEDMPVYRLIKNSNNTVESAIFDDIGSPSGNAIFVAAKESGNSHNTDSIKNKWLMVTSLDTQEAFKEVLSLRNLFIFITVIVLAISIIAVYIVVVRPVSIPLTKLKDAAIEIGKGNLDLVITPSSTVDEIGELSSQFGKMRARIKARTEELITKDKELEAANKQLKEKESILEKANEELKYLDRLKDEFISVASHELKTPIQPILGLSKALHSESTSDKQRKLLEIIHRNAVRLKTLADDILDVSRIESQTLKLNREKFILNDLVSSIVEEYKNELGDDNKSNIKLLYNPIEDDNNNSISVKADRHRITQVISNLMDNAIKFTKEEGGIVSINIKKEEEEENDSWVIVSIKDTGSGIDPEIMPRLFTKFTSKSFKGTGLGLFISKGIIEAHGGKIWAENNIDGKGATFGFSLPLFNQHK